MQVYSPSQTSNWMRCPVLRGLRNEGWVAKKAIKRDLAAIVGTCLSAGLGVYNSLRKEHETQAIPLDKKAATLAAMGTALVVLDKELGAVESSGRYTDEEQYVSLMRDRIGKGVTRYVANEPIPPSWRIVDVERELTDYGRARPDLVVRLDSGILAVVDWKSKVELKSYYRAKTLQEYANSHQQYHYAWAGQQVYGEPISRYYIGLLVLEPFSVELVPFPVDPESLALWEQSAKRVWSLMEKEDAGELQPFMSDRHADQFGACDYYDACFTYKFDPDLMKQKYVNTKDQSDG